MKSILRLLIILIITSIVFVSGCATQKPISETPTSTASKQLVPNQSYAQVAPNTTEETTNEKLNSP